MSHTQNASASPHDGTMQSVGLTTNHKDNAGAASIMADGKDGRVFVIARCRSPLIPKLSKHVTNTAPHPEIGLR